MTPRMTPRLALLTLLLVATSASAQKITPGLWEHTVTMKTASGQMEGAMAAMREQMAKMTPEQRKQVELTYNWPAPDGGTEVYGVGRNFGHLAYAVDDIYAACRRLQEHGVTIARPPRDGRMAFVRSPDAISVELLQAGAALPPAEPWASMPNVGSW